jgi:hypothetical protein
MEITLCENPAAKKLKSIFFNSGKMSGDCLEFVEAVYEAVTKSAAEKIPPVINAAADDVVYVKNRSLSEFPEEERKITLARTAVKGGVVFCLTVLVNPSALFEISAPEQIFFTGYTKKTAKLPVGFSSPLLKSAAETANINTTKSAEREIDFITKFNTELFHTKLVLNGVPVPREKVSGIYSENKTHIDLSGTEKRLSFISLYAITFHGLSLEQIFTVEQIFTLQPARSADNAKRKAANEVLALVCENNPERIDAVLEEMRKRVLALPRPRYGETAADIKTLYILTKAHGQLTSLFA